MEGLGPAVEDPVDRYTWRCLGTDCTKSNFQACTIQRGCAQWYTGCSWCMQDHHRSCSSPLELAKAHTQRLRPVQSTKIVPPWEHNQSQYPHRHRRSFSCLSQRSMRQSGRGCSTRWEFSCSSHLGMCTQRADNSRVQKVAQVSVVPVVPVAWEEVRRHPCLGTD